MFVSCGVPRLGIFELRPQTSGDTLRISRLFSKTMALMILHTSALSCDGSSGFLTARSSINSKLTPNPRHYSNSCILAKPFSSKGRKRQTFLGRKQCPEKSVVLQSKLDLYKQYFAEKNIMSNGARHRSKEPT